MIHLKRNELNGGASIAPGVGVDLSSRLKESLIELDLTRNNRTKIVSMVYPE